MIAGRRLLLAMLLVASTPALAAQSERSLLGYVGKSSFWIDAPAGWTPDPQAAKRFGALFVLTPPGTTFNNAGAIIIGSSYKDSSVKAAISKIKAETLSQDGAAAIVEQPVLQVGKVGVSLLEVRSKVIRSQPFETVAFIPLGNDVVVVTLSALAEEPFKQGMTAFMDMLKTYAEAGMEVKQGP